MRKKEVFHEIFMKKRRLHKKIKKNSKFSTDKGRS
jgi:hypothetical protein